MEINEDIIKKGYICCFTGHRHISDEDTLKVLAILDDMVEAMITHGVVEFRTGGAIGFDTLAALIVLKKREEYPHVRLQLYLPCRDQSDKWNERDKEAYEYIRFKADDIIYIRDKYHKGCMLERNRKMADGSHFCVGYCVSERGGSAYTLNYAKKHGLRVTNIAALMK